MFMFKNDEGYLMFRESVNSPDEGEWQRLHYLPNAYGYGVMWMPTDFHGTPPVDLPNIGELG